MIQNHDDHNGRDASGRFMPGHNHGFKAGRSGNPAGRKPGAVFVGEYLSMMATWTRGELQTVVDDDATPITQRIAARRLLAADDADHRIAGPDFDRVCDRTEGKPHQAIRVEQHDHRCADERAAALLANLRQALPPDLMHRLDTVPDHPG